MNRNLLREHLAAAKRHVRQGEAHLAKQEALISKLDRGGHDTTYAQAILATMRATQALHEQDRDRILAELAHEVPTAVTVESRPAGRRPVRI
jgi:hypothetical protein